MLCDPSLDVERHRTSSKHPKSIRNSRLKGEANPPIINPPTSALARHVASLETRQALATKEPRRNLVFLRRDV